MPKRKKDIRPGATVGQSTPADDNVPNLQLRRGQTIKTSFRGRHQPTGRPPTRTPRPAR